MGDGTVLLQATREISKIQNDAPRPTHYSPTDIGLAGFLRIGESKLTRVPCIAGLAVLTLDSEFAPACAMRGMARLEKKQFEQAVQDFNQALSIEPDMTMIADSRTHAREALRKAASVDFDVQLFEGLEELLDLRTN